MMYTLVYAIKYSRAYCTRAFFVFMPNWAHPRVALLRCVPNIDPALVQCLVFARVWVIVIQQVSLYRQPTVAAQYLTTRDGGVPYPQIRYPHTHHSPVTRAACVSKNIEKTYLQDNLINSE